MGGLAAAQVLNATREELRNGSATRPARVTEFDTTVGHARGDSSNTIHEIVTGDSARAAGAGAARGDPGAGERDRTPLYVIHERGRVRLAGS